MLVTTDNLPETNRWIDYCLRRALTRDTAQRYRLHSVLIRGGSVLAEGENLPVTAAHGKIMNPEAEEWMGLHAEMDCLRSATEDQLESSVLYVAGVSPTGKLLISKPCPYCTEILIEQPLKSVRYHNSRGGMRQLF